MLSPIVARNTVASEILRRRNLSERDRNGRPRPIGLELRGESMHVSFEEPPAPSTGPQQGRCSTRRGTDAAAKDFSADTPTKGGVAAGMSTGRRQHDDPQPWTGTKARAANHHDSASDLHPDGLPTHTGHARGKKTMWRTGLLYLDRGDSAIIAALANAGFNGNQQQNPNSPARRFSESSDSEHSRDGRGKHDMTQAGAQQWMMPADAGALKYGPSRARGGEDPSNTMSPTSDTTLFEEPMPYSLNQIPEDARFPDYFSYDGPEKDALLKIDRDDQQLVQKRRLRPQHPPSTPSSPSTKSPFGGAQRAPRLPVRAKTSEGLLQLQANAAKPPQRPSQGHGRRISLGLPIKSPTAPPEEQQSGPVFKPRTAPPSRRPTHVQELPSPGLNQQERDLEYKHRHTFIGTASLDDYLEVLDLNANHMATKGAVAKAFIVLAASERLLARQASSTPVGWELVPRVTPDVPNYDYVQQAHVRLGSITLWQFLELIPFDEREEVGAMSVVEAYSAASHLDLKAGVGNASKARAFRSWMVGQADAQSETRVSKYSGAS
jgi:hypothetical protein